MPRSLPRCLRLAPPRLEARPVGRLHGAGHEPRELAAVIDEAGRGLVGHGRGRDEVAAAELGGPEARLARRDVDDALDQIARLRAAGAAIGVDRRGVGEHALDPHINRRDGVDAGQHGHARRGRDEGREERQIGAEIGDGLDPERQDAAVGVERQLGMADMVAALDVGEEALGALGGPFDRPAQLLGEPRHHCLLGMDEVLHAEAAADVGRDHPKASVGQLERAGHQLAAQAVAALGRGVEHVAVAAPVVVADRGAPLHGVLDDAVVDEVELDHARGLGEGGLGRGLVAGLPVEGQVARHLVPGERRAGRERAGRVGHGGQRLVVDFDPFGGVARGGQGLADRYRHRVPHMASRGRRRADTRARPSRSSRRCS